MRCAHHYALLRRITAPLELPRCTDPASYASVLASFAEKIVDECLTDTDYVWIHDYHLLVLPSLLRKRFNRIRCARVQRACMHCRGSPAGVGRAGFG